MTKYILCITAYNCERQIVRVLEKVAEHEASNQNIWSQVIVIDNISSDKTIDVCLSFLKTGRIPSLKIFQNEANYGLGGSHKIAFQLAQKYNADGFIILHGDDQGNIDDLNRLPKDFREYTACLGARFAKGSSLKNYPTFRILGNKVFNFIYTIVLKKKIYDMGSGLNIFNIKYLDWSDFRRMPDDLTFNNFFLIYMASQRKDFIFFPISWSEEDQISNAKLLKQSKLILRYLVNYMTGKFCLQTEANTVYNSKQQELSAK